MSPEERRARGDKAKRLLEDALLVEAFATVEAAYLGAWKNTALGETQAREMAYMAVRTLADVRAAIRRVVTDGQIANAEIERAIKPTNN